MFDVLHVWALYGRGRRSCERGVGRVSRGGGGGSKRDATGFSRRRNVHLQIKKLSFVCKENDSPATLKKEIFVWVWGLISDSFGIGRREDSSGSFLLFF